MSDEHSPFPPADAEEERAASALRQALEGRAGGPDVPEAALETAALLRFGGDAGRLSSERRAALRGQLLASLPQPRPQPVVRRGWRLWLGLGLPLVGAAAAVAIVFVRMERAETDTGAQVAMAPGAAGAAAASASRERAGGGGIAAEAAPAAEADEAAPALVAAGPEREKALARRAADEPGPPQFERESRAFRERLLPKIDDARVQRIYAGVDRASSRSELTQAQAELSGLVSGAPGGNAAAEDVELLRQDIFCRLAEVSLRLGQAQAALDWARRGLALDGEPNPLLARLFALEAQAKSALGDPDGSARSYMKALDIHEQLLDESLEGP